MNYSIQNNEQSKIESMHLSDIINSYLLKCGEKGGSMSKRRLSKLLSIPKSTICDLATRKQDSINNSEAILKILKLEYPSHSTNGLIQMFSSNIFFGKMISSHKENTKEVKKTHGTDEINKYIESPYYNSIILHLLANDGMSVESFRNLYGNNGFEMLQDLAQEGSFIIREGKIFTSRLLFINQKSKVKLIKNYIESILKDSSKIINADSEIIHTNPVTANPIIRKLMDEFKLKLRKELKNHHGDTPIYLANVAGMLSITSREAIKDTRCLH